MTHSENSMNQSSVRMFALAAISLGAATTVHAQARVTPYAGFLASGSIANGPFGFEVGNAGAPVYGLQLGINLTPNIAIVGNVGYADSELEAGLPIIGGYSFADSKVLMYDGGVQLRFPATTSGGMGIVPYVEGGFGAIRNEITVGPVRTTSTNVGCLRRPGSTGRRALPRRSAARLTTNPCTSYPAFGEREIIY
jgi:hypothetical protein